MPKLALLKQNINSLIEKNIPISKSRLYFDLEIKGFVFEFRKSKKGTFYFRYRDTNKIIRMCRIGSLTEITPEEARMKAFEIFLLVKSGADPKDDEQYRSKKKILLKEIIRKNFYEYCDINKKEKAAKKSLIDNHIIPFFGDKYINSIKPIDIMTFQQEMKKKYSAGTVRQCLIHLKHIFNFVQKTQLQVINKSPFDQIPIDVKPESVERYLSEFELKKLLHCLDAYEDVVKSNIIRLLLMTGARKREILEMQWNEIDWQRKVLVLSSQRTKARRKREVYLSDQAIELLQSVKQNPNIPFVFFNKKTNKPFISIFTAWNTIRKRAELKDLRLHDLRHSFASFLINGGHTLYEVQKLLGHRDPKTTMRYSHLSDQSLSKAVNSLNERIEL